MCISVCVYSMCVYVFAFTQPLYNGQNAIQSQFVKQNKAVWIQSFPSSCLVAQLKLKNAIFPTINPYLGENKEASTTLFESLIWLDLGLNLDLRTIGEQSGWIMFFFLFCFFYLGESVVLHFRNVRYNSAALNAVAVVMKVMKHTKQWDAEFAWYSHSAPHWICRVIKVTNYTKQSDAEFAWYSPSASRRIYLYGFWHSLGIYGFRPTCPCDPSEFFLTIWLLYWDHLLYNKCFCKA